MNQKPNVLFELITKTSRFAEVLSEIGLAALMIMVFREVIWRYIFKHPSIFCVEISEYILIFITFMSAGWVLHEDRHVCMTAFTNRLSEATQLYLKIITSSLTMCLCMIIIWKGFRTVAMAYSGGYHSASLVNFPLWIAYLIIPCGMIILFLQYIVTMGNTIQALSTLKPGDR